MLIHPIGPSAWVRAVATRLPSGAATANPSPRWSISRQSAGTWFQPASAASAAPPSMSEGLSGRQTSPSEDAIADVEMRVLAPTLHVARHPVGDPVDHAAERDHRIAEQARRLRR